MDGYDVLNCTRHDGQTLFRVAVIEHDLSEVENDPWAEKRITVFVALVSSLALWAMIGIAIAEMLGRGPI